MADENRSAGTGAENPENKRVLVHADHVKVYFKGKEKKGGKGVMRISISP